MRVYRIEREKHLSETLLGIGSALSDSFRWNSMGTRLVYSSETRALACLEVGVHLDLSEDFPHDRFLVEIEIPDGIQIMELVAKDLPENWDSKPPHRATQLIGDAFAVENDAAVLRVPSSIIAQEFNYLINPHHTDSKKIKVVSSLPFSFDQRMKPL